MDTQSGRIEDAAQCYAKEVDAARKKYIIKDTPDNLNSLKIAIIRLHRMLIKLRRQSEASSLLRGLAASAETLVQRSQSDTNFLAAISVYTALADRESSTGDAAGTQKDLARAQELVQKVHNDADATYARYEIFEATGDSLLGKDPPDNARAAYGQSCLALEHYILLRTSSPPQSADADTVDLYSLYGSMSWLCVLSGDFAKSSGAAMSGLKLQPDAAWIEANLAHALLLSGKQNEAIGHYMKARKGSINGRSILEATREDFDTLRKLGFGNPTMDDILKQMAAE